MSGHSKWSTIKHQKAVTDAKRGKLFSKLVKAITIAVKEGGGPDSETNAKLRLAVEQAKSANMPKTNIKKAIERASGKGGDTLLQSVSYEGFGPEKVAVVVECITDNRNRTGALIKSFFDKRGGGLGSPGSTSYLFEKRGLVLVKKSENYEEQILELIDFGIDDVEEGGDYLEVYVASNMLQEFKEKIMSKGFEVTSTNLCLKPKTLISVADPQKAKRVIDFLEKLDDFDDVQEVYTNVDIIE